MNEERPLSPRELREALHTLPPEEFRALACAQELAEWRVSNRFCGACGAPMAPHADPAERAMVCSACGRPVYPRITPAVIVLVTKGDTILLQRNSHYGVPYGTLVAGFLDVGETLEEAVRREVREEASIEIGNLRYVRSQIWPFPSNIMVAFRAEWTGGELRPDGKEVLSSAWYARSDLPELPRPNSVARRLIDDWLAEGR